MSIEAEILEDMLDWFADAAHWTQRRLGTRDIHGQFRTTCLIGGLSKSLEGNEQATKLLRHGLRIKRTEHWWRVMLGLGEVIREQYPEIQSNGNLIANFNDDPGTTIEDVRSVVEKTLAKFQEEG